MRSTVRPFARSDLEAVIGLVQRSRAPELASLEQILGEDLFRRLCPDWRSAQRQAIDAMAGCEAARECEGHLVDSFSGAYVNHGDLGLFVEEVGGIVRGFAAVELDQDRHLGWMGAAGIDPDCDDPSVGHLLTESCLNFMKVAGMTDSYYQAWDSPAHAPMRSIYEETAARSTSTVRYFKALTNDGEPAPTASPAGRVAPTIRLYDADDEPAIIGLSLRCWEPVFAALETVIGSEIFVRLHPDWRADQQRAVRAVCSDPETTVSVAEVGGVVAGFVAVSLDTARALGELDMLGVDPAFQGNGLGLTLTQLALASMERAGMAAAVIETGGDAGHYPARRTYEAAGCTPVKIVRYFKAL